MNLKFKNILDDNNPGSFPLRCFGEFSFRLSIMNKCNPVPGSKNISVNYSLNSEGLNFKYFLI